MERRTDGPAKTVRQDFRRIPGSDWVLVFALFLAIVILGPIGIAVGSLAAWFIIFVAVGFASAYPWLRPLRR